MKSIAHLSNLAALVAPALLVSFALTGCGTTANPGSASADDSSASGIAAGSVGGALSGSGSGGAQALYLKQPASSSFVAALRGELNFLPKAQASSFCPTYKFTPGSGCQATGSEMWLSYSSCTFGGRNTWSGVQAISMSAGTAACGTFPNPGASGNLFRQAVTSAGNNTPGSWNLAYGSSTIVVDDATANLANFNNDTIATISNGGYGAEIGFNSSGARNSLQFGHHISLAGSYDHSVSGSLQVTESAGATTRQVDGSMKVYHNLLKIIGTATFNSVIHKDTCCLPVGGSITTAFTAGSNVSPTSAGSAYVGKSEVLTFTGCGTATLQAVDGSVTNVSLNRCI